MLTRVEKVEPQFLGELGIESPPSQLLNRPGKPIDLTGGPKKQRLVILLNQVEWDVDNDRGDVFVDERRKDEGFRAEAGEDTHCILDMRRFRTGGGNDIDFRLIILLKRYVER